MHQQIKASPGDTATNMRRVINVLARAHINIESIAPDFDPPHVRVAVKHNDPYDPKDPTDPFNRALVALREDGLDPHPVPSLPLTIPNQPGALQVALDALMRQGYVVQSILPLAEPDDEGNVSIGVAPSMILNWAEIAGGLRDAVQGEVDQNPNG
jgi:hypothetical protein